MSGLKYMFGARRRLSFAVVISAVVVAFITLVPFEYQRTMGYDATFSGIDVNKAVSPNHLVSVLKSLGYDGIKVDLTAGGDQVAFTVKNLPSRYSVREVTGVMAGLMDYEGQPATTPVVETVSGSLYAQVKSGLLPSDFNFDLDFTGKSDEEIKTMIVEQLKERGCVNADVTVDRIGTTTKITIKAGDSGTDLSKCSIGNFGLDGLDIQDKSKTDAEIQALIEQKLTAQGVTGANVTVFTDSEGHRSARIALNGDCK